MVATLLVVTAGLVGLLYLRRRWLSRILYVFDCELRLTQTGRPGPWSSGYARYDGDVLAWYRLFSLSLCPAHRLRRAGARIVGRRDPEPAEELATFRDHTIVQVQTVSTSGRAGVWELSMSPASAMGFLSWLEAAPPGSRSYR